MVEGSWYLRELIKKAYIKKVEVYSGLQRWKEFKILKGDLI